MAMTVRDKKEIYTDSESDDYLIGCVNDRPHISDVGTTDRTSDVGTTDRISQTSHNAEIFVYKPWQRKGFCGWDESPTHLIVLFRTKIWDKK